MSGGEAQISTRLVKGSDLAVGKRVRILAGVYAGKEGTVTRDTGHFRKVAGDDDWSMGWFAAQDLEPLEAGQ